MHLNLSAICRFGIFISSILIAAIILMPQTTLVEASTFIRPVLTHPGKFHARDTIKCILYFSTHHPPHFVAFLPFTCVCVFFCCCLHTSYESQSEFGAAIINFTAPTMRLICSLALLMMIVVMTMMMMVCCCFASRAHNKTQNNKALSRYICEIFSRF